MGETALALLGPTQPLPAEAIPASIINDLVGLESDLVLVLDDFHTIQNETIHLAISFLLDHLPEKFHLVVSTRVDPPWPLARFRARNQLIEIRAQDLRFTTEEAASFLNRMMGLNLAQEDIAALEVRTEGWIAGLQLAALSMKGRKTYPDSSKPSPAATSSLPITWSRKCSSAKPQRRSNSCSRLRFWSA